MWGLLHKDLKTISLQGRVLAIMVVFYLAFFLLSEAEDALISVEMCIRDSGNTALTFASGRHIISGLFLLA